MILYFSGTGNSQYVATYLQKKLKDNLLSINDFLKQKAYINLTTNDPLVIVCPVYVSAPPLIVMDFIKKSKFKDHLKVYFVMTCAGGMGASPYYWKKICQEKRFQYMGCEQVIMPQNYLIYFKTKEKEENKKIINAALPTIEKITLAIQQELPIALEPPGSLDVLSTKAVIKPYYKYFIKADGFEVSDACISCGKCEKVCPLNNIRLIHGLPEWSNNCTHCMACINRCPKQAIEYGEKTKGKPRYEAPKFK
ncbi:MAG: EFR1 family ferrodoxin [Bacillota bacterium]|nr:EFR1 family ferrodoxin [Bacillota bacterium]